VQTAHQVSEQLLALGVTADVRVLKYADQRRALEAGQSSFWLARWGCATGDAGELFENGLHSYDPVRRFGLLNRSGFTDPELDRAIEESAGIPDLTRRREALQQLMRMTMERLPWIPLSVDEDVYAVAPGIKWRPRAGGSIRPAEIELEP
jgi:peptide/nickel transport system substrate-binding protein